MTYFNIGILNHDDDNDSINDFNISKEFLFCVQQDYICV